MSDPSSSKPIQLFYSYSHKDEGLRNELETHLSALKRQGVISEWHDRKIGAGSDWAGEINDYLNTADLILLLISADFLASDYCYDIEMKRAMERHNAGEARVIPIILRSVDWQNTPLGKLQALPKDARPVTRWADHDEAFEDIAKSIRLICQERRISSREKEDRERHSGVTHPQPSVGNVERSSADQQGPEFQYSNLFQISSLTLPYVVLVGAWQKDINEYRRGEVLSVTDTSSRFQLPEDFRANPTPNLYSSDAKCRLVSYDCAIMRPLPNRLTFTFSRIEYKDYVMSGEYLDHPLPSNPNRTFREKYAPRLELQNFSKSHLTNICGVGVFIITRDRKIIVSRHSHNVQVYGGILSYSASGTMDWREDLHPFDEVARECYEEIGYRMNFDCAYLFGFGIDTKKLYFQFSFFERTRLASEEILSKARLAQDFHAEMEELIAVPFDLRSVIALLKCETWEPAAAAALLTLCTKEFGYDQVERIIDPELMGTRFRNEMIAEWEQRASRPGDLAVMSARYPYVRAEEESKRYTQAVMNFLGADVDDKDVLEIGAGIGRLTKWLVMRAASLTCIDLSDEMLERNRKTLGKLADKVRYLRMFGQDYRTEERHDAVISSLVLIHNIEQDDFLQLVDAMTACTDTMFLFEHIDVAYQVSSHTHPRSEEELLSAFNEFHVERRQEYQLFNDNIIFLKLVR
jgi:hypothetical protein